MITEAKPWPRKDLTHERYRECPMCSAWNERYEIESETLYDSGTSIVGGTLAGVTSGCSGTVTAVVTGGVGVVTELSDVSGASDGLAFTDGEQVYGVPAGSVVSAYIGTANGQAIQKKYGERRPTGECAFRDGHWWCNEHYNFRFNKQDVDTAPLRVEEIKYRD